MTDKGKLLMKSINSKFDTSELTHDPYWKDCFDLYVWNNKRSMLAKIGIDLWKREYDESFQEEPKQTNQLSLF